jgi:hypothetical protein
MEFIAIHRLYYPSNNNGRLIKLLISESCRKDKITTKI